MRTTLSYFYPVFMYAEDKSVFFINPSTPEADKIAA